jgi:hypothetical protein
MGAAIRKAASALPTVQRPKLETVTGDAPMKAVFADWREPPNVAPENGLFALQPQERLAARLESA